MVKNRGGKHDYALEKTDIGLDLLRTNGTISHASMGVERIIITPPHFKDIRLSIGSDENL
jgi:hypothetical protein